MTFEVIHGDLTFFPGRVFCSNHHLLVNFVSVLGHEQNFPVRSIVKHVESAHTWFVVPTQKSKLPLQEGGGVLVFACFFSLKLF